MMATSLGGSISYDVRNNAAQKVRTKGSGATIAHLYPTMFAIHDLSNEIAVPDLHSGWIPLPPHMRPSYMFMESHGVYLIGE